MGLETATLLAIGSMATTAVSTFVSMGQAESQSEAREAAARRTREARYTEATRRQEETNRVAQEKKSDVIRQAEAELGALRVAGGETGATPGSMTRMIAELGAVEGIDLGRIEKNRKSDVAKLQQDKKNASTAYTNTVTEAYNTAASETTNAVLGFAGSALQIGTDYHRRQEDLDIRRNKTGT